MNYANRIGYTDIYPCEVVKSISAKTVDIREMDAVMSEGWRPDFISGGFAGHCSNQYEQKWAITSNVKAPVVRIRLSKNNGWQDKYGHKYDLADAPRKFYDYNF